MTHWDIARCGGCGEPIRPSERAYDYHNPKRGTQIVARCHSENLACLIAWNERWHAAEGQEYDASFYRRHTQGDVVSELTEEQLAAVAAINAAIKRGETFALHGLAGTGKTTVAAHIAQSHPGAYLCAPTQGGQRIAL